MNYNAEYFIDKMMKHYQVDTLSALSNIIGISQPSISAWKKNEYISAIIKKCRELGIYDEIFGDTNVFINQGNGGRAAGRDYKEGVKSQSIVFEETTISLIKDLINKIGEEELQFKLMEMKRNA